MNNFKNFDNLNAIDLLTPQEKVNIGTEGGLIVTTTIRGEKKTAVNVAINDSEVNQFLKKYLSFHKGVMLQVEVPDGKGFRRF
ncbi:MAG: hypothetical protein KJ621_21110 [Proteobacteria bacterium]|nr:hypothetical protein [Pseudomonadota bacterium]